MTAPISSLSLDLSILNIATDTLYIHQHLKSITNVHPSIEASRLPRRVDLRGTDEIHYCLRILQ
jgi:hypothetical protein